MRKLHLGCGPTIVQGWDNLDKSPSVYLATFPMARRILGRARLLSAPQARGFPPGAIHANLARPLPYATNSVSHIYSSHMIEHLSRVEGLALLMECLRVLGPSGSIRIATPDLRQLADQYLKSATTSNSGRAADEFMERLGTYTRTRQRPLRSLTDAAVGGSWHQWLYDASSLSQLVAEAGFLDSDTFGYREGPFPDLALLENRPDSLIIQASAAAA